MKLTTTEIKVAYLDKLYYDKGKQLTDFELQVQKKGGFFSKRHNYRKVGFRRDPFLKTVNARTILKNEIVFDFDPPNKMTPETYKEKLTDIINLLKKTFKDVHVFDTGSRGIHVHVYENKMFQMNIEERTEYRRQYLKIFNADLQKASERTTINIEYAPHWKTGKIKFKIGEKNESSN